MSRIYLSGEPETGAVDSYYPYNVWFDEWEFYYQNEYVATQPEYSERFITPDSVIYYPIVITNTHPLEQRIFGLYQSSESFGRVGSYWDYDIKIIRDDNGDGIHQDTENTEIDETALLGPNEKFHLFVRVATPAPGKYSPDATYWLTSLV